jgi:Rod binding domain-containing protein
MQTQSSGAASIQADGGQKPDTLAAQRLQAKGAAPSKMRETFDSFVGETFYGQMLASMRKTVGKAAYFDGGRAEEIFRGQLDQVISQDLAKSAAPSFTEPMFELFALQQK